MVVTRIRQAGTLKPQVKVENYGSDKQRCLYKVSDGACEQVLYI